MDASLYDEFNRLEGEFWWFVGRRRIVISLLKRSLTQRERPSILDVGCGTGFNLTALQEVGDTYCVENSPDALRYLEKRGLRSRVVVAALPYLSLPRQYNAITCLDVLEHVREDNEALGSLFQCLRPGGLLLITVPAYQWLWSEHDAVNHHVRRYSKSELQGKVLRAGFKIERLTYFNTFLFPLAIIFRIWRKVTRAPESDFKYRWGILERIFAAVFSSESRLLSLGLNFPFGLSLVCVARRP